MPGRKPSGKRKSWTAASLHCCRSRVLVQTPPNELFYLHMQQDKTLACGVLQEPAISEGSSPRSKLVQGETRWECWLMWHKATEFLAVVHVRSEGLSTAWQINQTSTDLTCQLHVSRAQRTNIIHARTALLWENILQRQGVDPDGTAWSLAFSSGCWDGSYCLPHFFLCLNYYFKSEDTIRKICFVHSGEFYTRKHKLPRKAEYPHCALA